MCKAPYERGGSRENGGLVVRALSQRERVAEGRARRRSPTFVPLLISHRGGRTLCKVSQNLRVACGVCNSAHSDGNERTMTELPSTVRPILRRLARRVAVGLFLDIWPRWAIGGFLIAGTIALVCRIFFREAAPLLPWLWVAPLAATLPVLLLCARRAYRPAEIVAL